MKLKLPINPYPVQVDFLRCPADNVLYGGALGGGKSVMSVVKAYQLAMTYPGIHIGIFRRTLPEVRESIQRYCFELYPGNTYKYTAYNRTLSFINGSKITLNYLESDSDLINYEGWEFQVIIMDEAVRFTEYQLTKIRARLRQSKTGFRPRCYYTTNPIGVGANFFREKFVNNKIPKRIYTTHDEILGRKIEQTWCYIPAFLTDNKALMNNDPTYLARIAELPEHERDALLHAKWDSPAGRFFPSFSKDRHVIPSYAPDRHDQLFLSIDWGVTKPFCVYWAALTPERKVIIYREYYGQKGNVPDEGLGLNADVVARQILDRTPPTEPIKFAILDSACWSTQGADRTIADMVQDEFMARQIILVKSKKDRAAGLSLIRSYLESPFLQFTDSCKHAQRLLPNYVHSEKNDGDIAAGSEDHVTDCLAYLLFAMPVASSKKTPANTYGTRDYYKTHHALDKTKSRGIEY